jgi:hypothetical protein
LWPRGETLEDGRHTFASLLVALGVDPGSVMDQLGHIDPTFTLRVYRHGMRRDEASKDALRELVGCGQRRACPERPVNVNYPSQRDSMPETTLTPRSVRITEDEAKWLSAAATKGAVTQNDLLRLALHRLRKDLGAASRIKPETIVATAQASRYKLTAPRVRASKPVSPAKKPSRSSAGGKANACGGCPARPHKAGKQQLTS